MCVYIIKNLVQVYRIHTLRRLSIALVRFHNVILYLPIPTFKECMSLIIQGGANSFQEGAKCVPPPKINPDMLYGPVLGFTD